MSFGHKLNFTLFLLSNAVCINLVHAKTVEDLAVVSEKIDFEAKTNISAVSIRGASKQAAGKIQVFENAGQLELENIEITVPVLSLETGIQVRDKHMREKIFAMEDGSMPNLTFKSEKIICADIKSKPCDVVGMLSMHGKSKQITWPMKISKSEGSYRAEGETLIHLTDFGIAPPAHFGVSVENDVKVNLALLGKKIASRDLPDVAPAPAQSMIAENLPKAPMIKTATSASSAGKYTLQLAQLSVSSKEAVQAQIESLRAKGVQAFFQAEEQQGRQIYRILSGHFSTAAAALDYKSSLSPDFAGAFVTSLGARSRQPASLPVAASAPIAVESEVAVAAPTKVIQPSGQSKQIEVQLQDGRIVRNLSFTEAMAILKIK